MNHKVLLITPSFTQLNTPYPATAYLKGFLNTLDVDSFQMDMGIEVILKAFSQLGFESIFEIAQRKYNHLSSNSKRILDLKKEYLKTISSVIDFLQNKDTTLAYLISERNYLPEASRFSQLEELEWAFGTMGIRDKARHLATLYLEDVSDLIIEAVDPLFGFSRYAERIGRSASSFDELNDLLDREETFFDKIGLSILESRIQEQRPNLVALSVPFPGNLYSGFRLAKYIKHHHPSIKIALGGGFANTELRSVSDKRVFDYLDYICLDDGEATILSILNNLEGKGDLKRTFVNEKEEVAYKNDSIISDFKQKDVGTPDYSDLLLGEYLSVIEIANPMHRLWSDGRWNKLTLAHGCYWGKCTFCDISLDYIKIYESASAKILVDRIEEIIDQTGERGFHFVDEAAPPALMREVALEILKRGITVTWWANIRFEKSFTADLCRLLASSGCIAISGGLEVASERLLKLIDKGVTVPQVAEVSANFTDAGIMVHAYLMYGFPTQTDQETIDSLEIVRQLFELGIVQSGFWHQFAMTAHSPVGMNPDQFSVKKENENIGSFANNDLVHIDEVGCDHELYSEGLKKSLFNYMHGVCFEYDLQDWFDFKTKTTTIPRNYIEKTLNNLNSKQISQNSRIIWIGGNSHFSNKEKELVVNSKSSQLKIKVKETVGLWFCNFVNQILPESDRLKTIAFMMDSYEEHQLGDVNDFFESDLFYDLKEAGLLIL